MVKQLEIQACTLPTEAQPLRVREFDALLATVVRSAQRIGPLTLRVDLLPTPEVAATVANLLVRETACCSFFTFNLVASDGSLELDITVVPRQTAVLDAISERVRAVRA